MIQEVQEGVREYLKTHNTESQQVFGNRMKRIFDKPYLIPRVDPDVIKVLLCAIGYDTNKKANEAYDNLIKEINERENKIYNLVDPDMLENYKSK